MYERKNVMKSHKEYFIKDHRKCSAHWLIVHHTQEAVHNFVTNHWTIMNGLLSVLKQCVFLWYIKHFWSRIIFSNFWPQPTFFFLYICVMRSTLAYLYLKMIDFDIVDLSECPSKEVMFLLMLNPILTGGGGQFDPPARNPRLPRDRRRSRQLLIAFSWLFSFKSYASFDTKFAKIGPSVARSR